MKLITNNSSLSSEDLSREIEKFISLYENIVNSPDELIAFHIDISQNATIALLAAIKMGLKIAIIPTREPSSAIVQWLLELGINKYFYTGTPSFLDERIKHFSIEMPRKKISVVSRQRNSDNFSTIMRTSGTTGAPKNALIPAHAYYQSARFVNEYFSYTDKDCWALSLPFFHVSGLCILFRALLAKSSIFIADTYENLLLGLKQNQITHLSLVPAQLKRLLNDDADLKNLTAVIIGGDGLSSSLRKESLTLGIPLFETYGLTETASMIWVHDSRKNYGGLLPHATIAIADDGEILVGGSSLFDGYLTANGELLKPFIEEKFPTGDVGIFNFDQLQLINRKNNRIISGGENIQAEEIERVIESHPEVVSCIVVGINDHMYGQRPRAYIKWATHPVPDAHMRAFARLHLASYKIPKDFLCWPKDAPLTMKKPRRWFSFLPQN